MTNFNDAEIDQLGLFLEWRGDLADDWQLEAGVRYDQVDTDTDTVDAQPANLPLALTPGTPPFAVRMLRDRFNASDRSQRDHNIDWVLKLAHAINTNSKVEIGFARQNPLA